MARPLLERVGIKPTFHDFTEEGKWRRAIYVFGFTIIFALIAAGIVFLGLDTTAARTAVDGFIYLISLMIIFFLSTETIDRSKVLHNVGEGFRARSERTNIVVQSPDEVRSMMANDQTTGTTATDSNEKDDDSVG